MLPNKKDKREKVSEELSDQKRSRLGEKFAELQRELQKTKKSMLVIVDGWESSGRGYLLKDLTRELDPKNFEVSVFEESSIDESEHPYLYRYFIKAPNEGQIIFFDRSFYYDLFTDSSIKGERLENLIDDISFVEEALSNDDTLVVKFFLHQTKREMNKRIKKLEIDPYRHVRLDDRDYKQLKNYKDYYKHFDTILSRTNYTATPWNVLYVDGRKNTSRKALKLCIDQLTAFLDEKNTRESPELLDLPVAEHLPLNQVDLSLSISEEDYDKELKKLQKKASDLLFQVYINNQSVIVAYEGTDAAGKGGNIERLTRRMDPRGYDVATVSAPKNDEFSRHYLWRFYRDLPTTGRMTIFDRSWYGRVLVERIEELTPEYRWKEAYSEINKMEHNLERQGYLILKYLIVIDKDEQLERFNDRAEDPKKQYKLTDEDWRNHERFDDYKQAMNEMVYYTSTDHARWKVVSGTDKKFARIAVLKDFIKELSAFIKTDKNAEE